VSAKTGKGIEGLIKKIQQALDLNIENEDVVFARQRHIDALKAVKKLLEISLLSIENEEGLEVVAEPLRESLLIFDEIVGKTTTDDILENIFSSFCIGK
jgi:tRNA modification GTPase